MTPDVTRVLLLEDRPVDAQRIREMLASRWAAGVPVFEVTHVARVRQALEAVARSPFDVILFSLWVPDAQGLDAVQQLHAAAPAIPILILDGPEDQALVIAATRSGAQDQLAKAGLSAPGLVRAVRYAIERQRVEQALRTSERRFRALLENSADAIALVSSDGTILYESPAVKRLLGAAPEELIGTNAFDLIHPEDAELGADLFRQVRQQPNAPTTGQFRYRHADGTWLWVEATGANLLADPNVRAIVVNYRDVTERRRAAEQLQRQADEFAALYETSRHLAEQRDLPSLLGAIIDHAVRLLAAPSGAIFLYDAVRQDLTVAVVRGVQRPPGTRLHLGEGMAGRVAQTRQPLIIEDYQAWEHRSSQYHGLPFRAAVQVPLLHVGELLGVLDVSETDEAARRFSEADVHLLTLFAAQAASAVHEARQSEQTRRRLAELEAVSTISSALRTAQTLDEMTPRLLEQTLAILEAPAGVIWLYDPSQQRLRQAAARGWFAQVQELPMQPGEGIAGTVFATGEAHLSREFARDPRARAASREQIPPDWGGACVPIRTTGEIVGVLFASVPLPRELGPDEVRLLSIVTEIAGSAIHRLRLYEQTQQRLQHLAALRAVDATITASLDLRLTLDVLLDQVVTQLQVDAADVLLFNPYTQTLEYSAGRGFASGAITRSLVRLGEGLAGHVALERRTLITPNLVDAGVTFERAALLAGEQFAAYYGAPLIAKGQLKGVLEIFHRASHSADSEWLDFMETLAGQAAIAIDNAQLFDSLQRSNVELGLAYDSTLEGWSRALDLRDKETEGHTQRVTEMTLRLARAVGVREEEWLHLRRGALLHDIGKMGIPDRILLKPGPLTDEEWAIMRQHPQHAYNLLAPIAYLRPALDIPYCHHEKWDGTGYPRGLAGEQIPLAARVFAVADVYDALRSNRPYRAAWPEDQARAHIQEQAGTHFDPRVVDAFLRLKVEGD